MVEEEKKDNKQQGDAPTSSGRGRGKSKSSVPAKKVSAVQYAKTVKVSKNLHYWLKKQYANDTRTVDDWKKEFAEKGLA